jgi:hypothetical protein
MDTSDSIAIGVLWIRHLMKVENDFSFVRQASCEEFVMKTQTFVYGPNKEKICIIHMSLCGTLRGFDFVASM